ncbi:unnamed protein product [Adineta steineri]|uniref:Uncharacterized protein n=1 Tax=Adineta steineri TaxID=433720 RepID=A0A819YJZ8_9BILA|nr:unnamed protein product [Adineta steineri]
MKSPKYHGTGRFRAGFVDLDCDICFIFEKPCGLDKICNENINSFHQTYKKKYNDLEVQIFTTGGKLVCHFKGSPSKPSHQSKLKYEPNEDINNEKHITLKINELYEKYDRKLKDFKEITTNSAVNDQRAGYGYSRGDFHSGNQFNNRGSYHDNQRGGRGFRSDFNNQQRNRQFNEYDKNPQYQDSNTGLMQNNNFNQQSDRQDFGSRISTQQQHLLNPMQGMNSYQVSSIKSFDMYQNKSFDLNSITKRRSTVNHFTYPMIQ